MRIGPVPGRGEGELTGERARGPIVPAPARPPDGATRSGARPSGARQPGRLTAIGAGVLAIAATLLGAAVDAWLFDGPGILFGLVFLVTCFQVAVRVRSADLMAAPISAPIAFAFALLLCGRTSGPGAAGVLVGLAEGLAMQAGWLFAGTGVAALIALARWTALRRARARRR